MPPRFAYWTILVGGLPTAFRAAQREEIEPTFRRLQQKHPDAEMRWFARGRLWASPEEASEALSRQRAQGTRHKEGRDRSWRPGGTHRDPRQPYKDAKKRENQKRRERRFEFKNKGSGLQAPGSRPHEERPKWKGSRPQGPGFRPREERPKWNRPPGQEQPRGEKPAWKPKPEWKAKPKTWERPGPKWGRPKGHEWKGPKPQATGSRPHEERPKWKRPIEEGKPEGEKPWKPRPRPGAWSPKPGARKGPRGPR